MRSWVIFGSKCPCYYFKVVSLCRVGSESFSCIMHHTYHTSHILPIIIHRDLVFAPHFSSPFGVVVLLDYSVFVCCNYDYDSITPSRPHPEFGGDLYVDVGDIGTFTLTLISISTHNRSCTCTCMI